MQKLAAGILVTAAVIIFVAFAFTLYAQFALDYSLENLKLALERTQEEVPSDLDHRAYRASLESMALEEVTRKDADLETVVLLEHAARSIRDAVERSAYARAGAYVAEILKEKVPQRNLLLQIGDATYHFFNKLVKSLQDFWNYLWRRLKPVPEVSPLAGTGVLILGEAERMEKAWKLNEAERYYHEFLDRYPGRPERGFVTVSLAHVLTKMRRLDEADELLQKVRKEFFGTREETLAVALLNRIAAIRRRLAYLPQLENWIKSEPDRIFAEEGGLELALSYLATYQVDRAMAVLDKLEEAPDPRIRAKSLFYRGWIHKWQGDLSKGKEIFQALRMAPKLEDKLATAAQAELAEVLYESREYDQAISEYEQLSRKAARESTKALWEVEHSHLSLFGVTQAEDIRQRLQKLDQTVPRNSPLFEISKLRLEEAFQKSLRDQGFAALREGRAGVAFRIFQNYLKKFPRDGVVHSALGSIYLLRGSLNEAAKEAETGYRLHPDEYTATVLGYVYEKTAKTREAEEYYSVAIEINPTYLTPRFNLSVIYASTGRVAEADQLLAELEKETVGGTTITRAKILNNRGYALWFLGEREEAVGRFQEALKAMPGLPEAQQNLNLAAHGEPVLA